MRPMPRDGLDLDPAPQWGVEGDGALPRVRRHGPPARTREGGVMADTYTIGQGVKDALAAAHDEPRSDEMYFGQDAEGHSYGSVTHGRDALYRWDAVDNAVKRLP